MTSSFCHLAYCRWYTAWLLEIFTLATGYQWPHVIYTCVTVVCLRAIKCGYFLCYNRTMLEISTFACRPFDFCILICQSRNKSNQIKSKLLGQEGKQFLDCPVRLLNWIYWKNLMKYHLLGNIQWGIVYKFISLLSVLGRFRNLFILTEFTELLSGSCLRICREQNFLCGGEQILWNRKRWLLLRQPVKNGHHLISCKSSIHYIVLFGSNISCDKHSNMYASHDLVNQRIWRQLLATWVDTAKSVLHILNL